jgi:UDP-glucose 4-epimerase
MQTIIVTGGAGYIGSHTIVELLNNSNYDVISVDNYSNSSSATYDRIRKITKRHFRTLDIDLCDEELVFTEFRKIENIAGIIHFAAFKSVPDSVADPVKYYHNNNASLLNLLKFCKQKQIHNFIFSSSCSVYGNAKTLPVTEETPLARAESPYGHTKQMGEEILEFFCASVPSFKTVVLRYFNPVGAHMSGLIGEYPIGKPNNLVPIITQTAAGKNSLTVFGNKFDTKDGYCVRDYIHVTDIADAHIKALDYLIQKRNKKQLSLYNLGTGEGVSVMEVIRSFEKVSGQKLSYQVGDPRPGDVVAVYANNTLAKKELGWKPQFGLDDMMLSAWKWQQNLDNGAA